MNIQAILTRGVQLGASDIHLNCDSRPVYRIQGELWTKDEGIWTTEFDIQAWLQTTLSNSQSEKFASVGHVDFVHGMDDNRFRCNAFLCDNHVSLAIRIIPSAIPTLADLRLPSFVAQLCHLRDGLILITGPTGHGKSTTLAAMLNEMNHTYRRHIITLEDPVEYRHKNHLSMVHQREIGTDSQDFVQGLQSALRQDPDVIIVGELRELETVRTALTASETGHLVLSTLHTGDAVQTVDRLIDMFPADYQNQVRAQLADVLRSVVSQRLVPDMITGERVAMVELLVNTPAVAHLIRGQKTHQLRSIMQTSKQLGMQTFAAAAQELLQQGRISEGICRAWTLPSS